MKQKMKSMDVLVVVDTQIDFAFGSLGTKQARESIPNIEKKIVECGNAGYRIFATKDTHTENYLTTNEGKHLPVPHTILGTRGHDLVPPIKDAISPYNPTEVKKSQFGSMELVDIIKEEATDTSGKGMNIMLIGWCTDICVIANAVLLKTAFPEAEITVDSSCCAGVTPETHEATLTVMKSLQINVI